jgi:RNA polymerase sigma-70 factor (ECF subfamily)
MTSVERTADEENERRLIEGLRNDDREALSAIYALYGGIAYGLAVRTLGVTSDAEDVVQESFVALWRQAARLDPTRGLRSYLLTIVHNKAVDRLRRRGRRPEVPLEPDAPIQATRDDPVELAERRTERDLLRAALQDLPPDQKRAVEMTYFGGMTINEAAMRLQVPLGTVKSRLRLALERLRRNLGDLK